MTQSRKHSILEALLNTFIGLLTTLLAAPLIYWICGITMSYASMTYSTILFTLVSVIRNYIIRRWFNHKQTKYVNRN